MDIQALMLSMACSRQLIFNIISALVHHSVHSEYYQSDALEFQYEVVITTTKRGWLYSHLCLFVYLSVSLSISPSACLLNCLSAILQENA